MLKTWTPEGIAAHDAAIAARHNAVMVASVRRCIAISADELASCDRGEFGFRTRAAIVRDMQEEYAMLAKLAA